MVWFSVPAHLSCIETIHLLYLPKVEMQAFHPCSRPAITHYNLVCSSRVHASSDSQRNLLGVSARWSKCVLGDLRLTEFDQILVCGSWVEATDIKVGFAQLLSPAAAVTAAIANCGGVAVGAWGSHLMIGRGHICLLWRKQRALFRYMKLDVRMDAVINWK